MKSTEFLQAALDVQKERGEQYDKPNGERSMAATVSAFNTITGQDLKESDGWMFMALLKLVRQAQNPEKYHHDSALDLVAYSSLYAEAASEQCARLQEDHIGYKEDAITLEAEQEEAPKAEDFGISWDDAPAWAAWLALDLEGAFWFRTCPESNGDQYKNPGASNYLQINNSRNDMLAIKRPGA